MVVRLRESKRTKMADISSTFLNNNNISNTSSARADLLQTRRRLTERQLAMERAGTRQRLALETPEGREVRLHHGGELVEGGVLHRRLPNSERHASSTSLATQSKRAKCRLTQ